MKKSLLLGVIACSLFFGPSAHARHGDSVAGGLLGGLAGGMLAGTIARGGRDRGPSRAEIEARRAQDQTEQIRREQQQREIQELRAQVAQRDVQFMQYAHSRRSTPLNYLLLVFIFLMIVGVIGMGFMAFGKSPRRRDRDERDLR